MRGGTRTGGGGVQQVRSSATESTRSKALILCVCCIQVITPTKGKGLLPSPAPKNINLKMANRRKQEKENNVYIRPRSSESDHFSPGFLSEKLHPLKFVKWDFLCVFHRLKRRRGFPPAPSFIFCYDVNAASLLTEKPFGKYLWLCRKSAC